MTTTDPTETPEPSTPPAADPSAAGVPAPDADPYADYRTTSDLSAPGAVEHALGLDVPATPSEARVDRNEDGSEVQRTTSGIRVNDRRRISREDAEAPVAATLVPKKVKKFFDPPPSVKGLIVPVSGQVDFSQAKGFDAPCSKGWARVAAERLRAFQYALGSFQGQYGVRTHVITFDRTSDKIHKDGYSNPDKPRPPPSIGMQGDPDRVLHYHVITLPVRALDDAPFDLDIIASSLRRLRQLLDTVPSLAIYTAPGSFWMPVLRDKNTPWPKLAATVVPYLDPRVTIIEESIVGG